MSPDRPFDIYKRLLTYLLPFRGRLLVIILSLAVSSGAMLTIPWMAKNLFRQAVLEKQTDNILKILGGMLAIFAVVSLLKYLADAQLNFVSLRMLNDLRRDLVARLLRLPIPYFIHHPAGDAISRTFADVAKVRAFLHHAVVALFSDLLLVIGSLATLFYLNWELAIITLGTALVGLSLIGITARFIRHGYQHVQAKQAEMTSLLAEQLHAMPAIRAFGGQSHEEARFDERAQVLFSQALRTDRLQAASRSLVNFLGALGVVLVLGVGAYFAAQSPDDLLGFAFYALLLAEPITRLSHTNYEIQQSLASGRRVFEILDTPEEHHDGNIALSAPPKGKLTYESVQFSYDAAEAGGDRKGTVLHGVSVTIHPGETVAVVGPSGAGKSTLSYLPLRFYEPTSGRVLLDDTDVHDIRLEDLRRHIGWVGQDPFVFSGTIADNIAYGSWDATREQIIAAAKQACAHDFISALPNGYDTPIGERGVDLSGGQRVRLAIARVILRSPSLVIFDESTASLDTETERRLWSEIQSWIKHRTTLIIAHRLTTVLDCPRILVVEAGQIVGDGPAHVLHQTCPTFVRIFKEQMDLKPQMDADERR